MTLYLVQHGLAVSEEQDPKRPLSVEGRTESERVAAAAARAGLAVKSIHHSGRLRAAQTAEIFAAALRPAGGIAALDGIDPKDSPEAALLAIAGWTQPAMIVGHMPHLEKLAAMLITGSAGKGVISFRNAAVNALVLTDDGWRVKFVMTPELV
ncbi:MAG: phosphohistidine phosphatase SixA [Planctomycetota bacterium]|nr:phosphohistidine phosphatase SixA [Planctomycetota bacterium]